MRYLYVPLDPAFLEKLKALARRERRDPRVQAAYLLEQALEREGLLAAPARREAAECR